MTPLDVSRLHDLVLAPLLAIGDERTDKRIEFVGGIRGTGELEKIVKSGGAAVAFSMFPVTVNDLMAIADAGATGDAIVHFSCAGRRSICDAARRRPLAGSETTTNPAFAFARARPPSSA